MIRARDPSAEFSWEKVKADKDKECYLGHSVRAPTGRWAQGKDLFWYEKKAGSAGARGDEKQRELAAIKQMEEDAMLVALCVGAGGCRAARRL